MDSAIIKARKIPRRIALLKVRTKDKEERPIYITKYDPRLPSVQSIQLKHWRSMVKQNQYLAEVFKEPPLTAYRRQRNLRDILIKSKVKQYIQAKSTRTSIFTLCPGLLIFGFSMATQILVYK